MDTLVQKALPPPTTGMHGAVQMVGPEMETAFSALMATLISPMMAMALPVQAAPPPEGSAAAPTGQGEAAPVTIANGLGAGWGGFQSLQKAPSGAREAGSALPMQRTTLPAAAQPQAAPAVQMLVVPGDVVQTMPAVQEPIVAEVTPSLPIKGAITNATPSEPSPPAIAELPAQEKSLAETAPQQPAVVNAVARTPEAGRNQAPKPETPIVSSPATSPQAALTAAEGEAPVPVALVQATPTETAATTPQQPAVVNTAARTPVAGRNEATKPETLIASSPATSLQAAFTVAEGEAPVPVAPVQATLTETVATTPHQSAVVNAAARTPEAGRNEAPKPETPIVSPPVTTAQPQAAPAVQTPVVPGSVVQIMPAVQEPIVTEATSSLPVQGAITGATPSEPLPPAIVELPAQKKPLAETAPQQPAVVNTVARTPVTGRNEASKPETPIAALPAPGVDAAVMVAGVEAPAPLTPVQTTPVASAPAPDLPEQQIAERVQIMVDNGDSSATIRLRPQDLGGVRIRLQIQDGEVHLSIQAEKPQTGRLFENRIDDLRQSLVRNGLKVGHLTITAAGQSPVAAGDTPVHELLSPMRAMQTDMGGNPSNAQAQPQPFLGGQGGNNGQRGGLFQPHAAPQDNAAAGPATTGETLERRRAVIGVDYYV